MIVVATDDFALYHAAVGELRERGATFTTVEPGADLPDRAEVVVSAAEDGVSYAGEGVDHVTTTAADARAGVEEALGVLRGADERLVVGVDPGDRPGVAVLSGDTVVAAFHVPLSEVVGVVREQVADEPDALVRVGDGDRLRSARVVNDLEDATVELVDETGTTPSLGAGAAAKGIADVLAAVNIARREGDRVETRDVEPTPGEIQRVKNESRERSDGEVTVDADLARRVALGDVTMDEALAAYDARGEGADGSRDSGE
ncbi:hypothetical protein [Candidatus Halobonum tyrrellensis]|uniref:Uncharacterized protein n=1 Tax=Candidatus Halobonum tyrrellensis G22 TaxID=1324957 RepID=V4IZ79_9EURY|nr:hypothetical protein [Candidatus Halobonum tyrrellensis]ESP88422.1 hypothetical protein K933_08182 [Candidatus Halobonum tyrrellensis G22]